MKPFQQRSRLVAVFTWALLIGCALTACSPTNPLDHRVDASDLGTFSDWWDHEQRRLTPEFAAEVNDAFIVLEQAAPRLQAPDLNASNDPFCRKVNGLSLRDVLIDATMQQNHLLLDNISRETTNLEKMMSERFDEATGNAALRRDWVIKHEQEMIEQWKAEMEKNEARIAKLKSPPAR